MHQRSKASILPGPQKIFNHLCFSLELQEVYRAIASKFLLHGGGNNTKVIIIGLYHRATKTFYFSARDAWHILG